MSLWKRLNSLFGGEKSTPPTRPLPPVLDDEPEIIVPEVTVEQLQASLTSSTPPLVIDVREAYEWRIVRIAPSVTSALHIPMNEVPAKLDTLPDDREIVVVCAAGSRSYSVAGWLNEQGLHASSLAGGITQWAAKGGAVDQG